VWRGDMNTCALQYNKDVKNNLNTNYSNHSAYFTSIFGSNFVVQNTSDMKKLFLGGAILAITALAYAFVIAPNTTPTPAAAAEIKWYTWDEAIQLADKKPKKIFIDLYTDWCGWCKKMDKTTFQDPAVVKYMNENFYAVKFDAEQKEEVKYKDYTFKYLASGSRGVNELAYSLLDGKLSYPSYVYLDDKQNRISISPGYKTADSFIKEIKYFGGNHYEKITYQEYIAKGSQ